MNGLVGEPVAWCGVGNAAAEMRSLPAGLGKTQRPVDRGAGGNRRQSGLSRRAARGASRLPDRSDVLERAWREVRANLDCRSGNWIES
jgi:hypothetical protein